MHDVAAVMMTNMTDSLLLGQSVLLLLWDKVWPILAIFAGFSLIIFVHELGHFAVAKWCDVRVEKFAIGFGKEIWGFSRGETRYSFNVLPMGGYVKMLGQEDFDDKTLELKAKHDPRSFANKGVGQRMAIVSAGVIMNLIFAFLLFIVVFMVGVNGVPPTVGPVVPDTPAHRAGLRGGDLIRSINGTPTYEFKDLMMSIVLAAPFEPLEFVIERGGETLPPVYITPEDNVQQGQMTIGIRQPGTRRIAQVSRTREGDDPTRPRIGDMIVEVGGQPVTDESFYELFEILPYFDEFVVERKDPKAPAAPPQRVTVRIDPDVRVLSTDAVDRGLGDILGMVPLTRFENISPRQRADLAGIEQGDTVLMWDDVPLPTATVINRAVLDNPERDIAFVVRKEDGRIHAGFVRPGAPSKSRGTIQAWAEAIADAAASGAPRARLIGVKPGGAAHRAGLATGDVVLRWDEDTYPSPVKVNRDIELRRMDSVTLTVRKPDGREHTATLAIQKGGMIQALPQLIASEDLTVAAVIAQRGGRPTAAAAANIPAGAALRSIGGESIKTWKQAIATFRAHAGKDVEVVYQRGKDEVKTTLHVPATLRTALNLPMYAWISSVDGVERATVESARGAQEPVVQFHEALANVLSTRVGKTVEVKYYRTPLAPMDTASVQITEEMLDPWDARIQMLGGVWSEVRTFTLQETNPLGAIRLGIRKTYDMVMQVYQTIDRMAFSRSLSADNISGPVGIVSLGGNVARQGTMQLFFFLAMLSANLAVLNFLPLPIVDGGLMVFLLIEKIKGSPVNIKIQVITQTVGIVLIVSAFLYVTFNDVVKLFN